MSEKLLKVLGEQLNESRGRYQELCEALEKIEPLRDWPLTVEQLTAGGFDEVSIPLEAYAAIARVIGRHAIERCRKRSET